MSANNRVSLVALRRELVDQTVADSIQTLGGHRPPPTVDVVRDGESEGRFDPDHNRVEIRIRGFLGDPSVSDARIRAAVAHEMGHWSDSTMATRLQRERAVWWTGVVAPILLLVLGVPVVVAIEGARSPWPAAPAAAAVAVFVAAAVLIARLRWPSEYFADAAAARVVGAAAVIEMVKTFRPGRFSHTHPRPEDRLKRLEQLRRDE